VKFSDVGKLSPVSLRPIEKLENPAADQEDFTQDLSEEDDWEFKKDKKIE
jgi:hypothetical protein